MMVLIFIIMTTELLQLTEYMVNMGIGLKDIFKLIICLLPKMILLAMPVACLMAVLLSFIRMGSDNEIVALHSSGISLYQLMPPVVIFCFICLIFSFLLTMLWSPYGARTEKSFLISMKSKAGSLIKEKIKERVLDSDLINDVMFYVNNYSPDGVMEDLFIVDKRHGREKTFVAKKGRFISGKNGIMIQLFDGSVFPDDRDGKSQVHSFKVFTYKLELDDMVNDKSGHDPEPEEMYPGELIGLIRAQGEDSKNKILANLTFYEMFSLPLAVFLIGIAGAPLGAQIRAQGRTKGIVISLLLFLSYYGIFMAVRVMSEKGAISPAFGVWLPVIFLLIISIFLLMASSGRLFYSVLNRLVYSRLNPR